MIISEISGSYSNVVGLPVELLREEFAGVGRAEKTFQNKIQPVRRQGLSVARFRMFGQQAVQIFLGVGQIGIQPQRLAEMRARPR